MSSEPQSDCPLCPRLVAFRQVNRQAYPEFFNAPVPSFGGTQARLLIVGLAPGLQGANRTGRPFTGDHAVPGIPKRNRIPETLRVRIGELQVPGGPGVLSPR